MSLSGRTAIVTGASKGLGRAFAVALAEAGVAVTVNGRDEGAIDDVVSAIKATGGRAHSGIGDVGQPGMVDKLVRQAVDRDGRLDIMVNNAAIIRPKMLWNLEDDDWLDVLRVDLTGVFYGVRAAARVMRDAQRGTIINVASAAGIHGAMGQANYAAAKAGVIALTKSAARELAKYGVTVNAISPVAETEMNTVLRTDPRFASRFLDRVPMGRFASAEEVARTLVVMATDAMSYTTGSVVLADGGLSI